MDVLIKIKDREGLFTNYKRQQIWQMNIMELCKAYELPVEGTCGGMATCALPMFMLNDVELPPIWVMMKKLCYLKLFM